MKIKILFFLILSISIFAQDFEPEQIKFKLTIGTDSSEKYLSADLDYFKQNHFILGWAWGFGIKMSDVLLDNQAHVRSNYSRNSIKNNINLIINTDGIECAATGAGVEPSNCQSVCYSPVLLITNPESQQNTRQNDPHHFIFGFKYIK